MRPRLDPNYNHGKAGNVDTGLSQESSSGGTLVADHVGAQAVDHAEAKVINSDPAQEVDVDVEVIDLDAEVDVEVQVIGLDSDTTQEVEDKDNTNRNSRAVKRQEVVRRKAAAEAAAKEAERIAIPVRE